MHTTKVTTVGDSLGIVIPHELLKHLRVSDGDEVQLSETSTGVELTTHVDEFSRQLEVAKKVMLEDREVLRKLAE